LNSLEFIYPQFFLMFPLPLIWLVYRLITKKRAKQNLFSAEILKKLKTSSGGISSKARSIITLISLLLMVIALARPVIKEGVVEVESKSVDIVIALDISKSMLAEDRYPNRLDFSKRKIVEILHGLDRNRVGVIAFANSGYTVSPLTFDKKGVEYLVRNIDSQNISAQGTSILKLLQSADMFLKENRDKLLIIFTDGGDSLDYTNEIEFAKDSGMDIFVIGVGSESGSPIKLGDGQFLKNHGNIVITKFNPAIKNLALKTGGVFMKSVNSQDDVEYILKEIKKIDSEEIKKDEITIYMELFIYPLIFSLILLFPIFYSFPKIRKLKYLLLLPLVFPNGDIKAGIFDWYYLNKADTFFQNGNYAKAIQNYSEIKNSDEVKFNIGNSWYLDKNYSKAIENYSKIENPQLKQNSLYNIGNSYVQLEKLEKAKTVYEKALILGENPKIRENLEWVKNRLKKDQPPQKQKQQDNKKSDKNDSKKNENQKQENGKKGDSEQDKSKNQEQKNGEKPKEQDKVDSRKGETDNHNKMDSEKPKDSEDENRTKSDRVLKTNDDNLTEIRELNQSEKQIISGSENIGKPENMEELKLLKMLDRMRGGTKIYSIPTNFPTNISEQNQNPW